MRIPDHATIRKVKMWGDDSDGEVSGIQFFDKDDNMILEAGYLLSYFVCREFVLEEGERLIGVKSRTFEGFEPR